MGVQEQAEEKVMEKKFLRYNYPDLEKTQGDLHLKVEAGEFTDTEIIVLLGENGTGKTTFIRMLAGLTKPDEQEGEPISMPEFNMSYKPQKISPKFEGPVRALLHKRIKDAYMHPQFNADVMKPLNIDRLMDQEVKNLSGGELQR